jgi:hypothetical protein
LASIEERPMTMSETYPASHPQAISRIIEGEAVIVLPESGQVGVLNEVGTRVWELTDGRRSLEEIVAAIVEEFEITPERARQDVDAFVQELVEKEMLILSAESTER